MIDQVTIVPEQSISFDYSVVDNETARILRTYVDNFHKRYDIADLQTARELKDAKARLGHGLFQEWVKAEFQFSPRTAQRKMRMLELLGEDKNDNLSLLPQSAIYELAAPSTPASAIEEVSRRIEAGDKPSGQETKQIIQQQKRRETLEAKRKEEVGEFLGWVEQRVTMTEEEREQESLERQQAHDEEEQAFRDWWGGEVVNPIPWTEKDKRGYSHPVDLQCSSIFDNLDTLISDCYTDSFTEQRWAYVEEMRRRIDKLLSKRGVVESI